MRRRAPTASSCSAITPGKRKFVAAANGAAPDPITPPPLQQSTSPEMALPSGSKRRRMKMGLVSTAPRDSTASSASGGSICSSGGEIVYGSPVMGLAVGRFRDRRKTRPTAILTVDAGGSDGGDALCLSLRPAMASVRWLGDKSLQHDKENESSSFEFPLAGGESIELTDKDPVDDDKRSDSRRKPAMLDRDFSTTNKETGSMELRVLGDATNNEARN